MDTENSVWYFRGREACGRGECRDEGARLKDALHRSAWLKGWDDEKSLRRYRERTEQEAADHAEGVAWMKEEIRRWKSEIGVR